MGHQPQSEDVPVPPIKFHIYLPTLACCLSHPKKEKQLRVEKHKEEEKHKKQEERVVEVSTKNLGGRCRDTYTKTPWRTHVLCGGVILW